MQKQCPGSKTAACGKKIGGWRSRRHRSGSIFPGSIPEWRTERLLEKLNSSHCAARVCLVVIGGENLLVGIHGVKPRQANRIWIPWRSRSTQRREARDRDGSVCPDRLVEPSGSPVGTISRRALFSASRRRGDFACRISSLVKAHWCEVSPSLILPHDRKSSFLGQGLP